MIGGKVESIWEIQEAEDKFTQLLRFAKEKGPQTVLKNGHPEAVVISFEAYKKLLAKKKSQKKLSEFFSESPLADSRLELEFERIKS